MATNIMHTDLHLITSNPGYVDVDIYVTCPSGEEYLVREFKVVGKEGFAGPTYRYAADKYDLFNDLNHIVPAEVVAAVDAVLPKVHRMILEAEAKLPPLVDISDGY